MKRILILALTYVLFFGLGTALGATSTVTLLPSTDLAPATAQKVPLDSLPPGRHQVSTYRNGSSTEFTVENGAITMLKIDGKEIPAERYDEYRDMVEDMLGGNRGGNHERVYIFDVFDDPDNLDDQSERIERYFEKQGEHWERLGEEFARRFENMFRFDEDNGTFRFYFDGDGEGFEFEIDSIARGRDVELRRFEKEQYELEDIIREHQENQRSTEDEIEELETMIERMERRKAEAEARLEAETSDEGNSFSYNGVDFKTVLQGLRANGDLPPGVIRSFTMSAKYLKVNGEKVAPEVHERVLDHMLKRSTFGKKFSISLEHLDW